MKLRNLLAVVLSIAVLYSPQPALALAQRTGDFELEIDAPWRMEPRGESLDYGAIPIQVSIHDADQPNTFMDRRLQQIITVTQQGLPKVHIPATLAVNPIVDKLQLEAILTFAISAIAEVLEGLDSVIRSVFGFELIPADLLPSTVTLKTFQSLVISEEIGGVFVPQQTFTLSDIHEVEKTVGLWRYADNQQGPESPFTPPARPLHSLCRRWQGEDCSSFAALRPTSEWNLTALYTPATVTPGRDVRLRAELRVSVVYDGVASTRTFRRILAVHLGEEPLPTFGAGWAYGDLHHHAQGTDNDGESGYSYRGTLQAMGALGLDFAFATDHASNSRQIGSISLTPTRELLQPLKRGLRDMSPDRFAFGIELLNGSRGGNREVTSYPRPTGFGSSLVAPQLFLGGEVDVIPEAERISPTHFCKDVPGMLKMLDQATPFPDDYWCETMGDPQPDGRMLAFDVQGPDDGNLLSIGFYARQHLLHLPVDAREDAFIASNTSEYGGATRRLGEILEVELAQRQKGYAFLAHPFNNPSGAGVDRLGPDLIAYTPEQLSDAFASPYILGLQIWNEDSLFSAAASDVDPFASPQWQSQHQPNHAYDFQQWDIQQLFGLDRQRTQALSWLGADEPRRVFAAGGSDSHGDWNYRRVGAFFGTQEASSTALGTPRNLVYVDEPEASTLSGNAGIGRPFSQTQVVDGLRSGNFAITDGPAVRIVVDVDGDGTIDPDDVPMGGLHRRSNSGPFQVIVEWKSSPEFSPVSEIRLLVGVWAEGFVNGGMMYTRSYEGPIANFSNTYVQPETGAAFVKGPSIPYWYDPNPANPLFITPSPSEAYHGQRVVTIDPSLYPVGQEVCVLSDAVQMASSGTPTSSRVATSEVDTNAIATTTDGGAPAGDGGGTVVALQKSLTEKLNDMELGIVEPSPDCIRREFRDARLPDRMFVRAEVRNEPVPGSDTDCSDAYNATPQCVYRQAFSNPVWINVGSCSGPVSCDALQGLSEPGLVLDTSDSAGTLDRSALVSRIDLIGLTATTTVTSTPTTTTTTTTTTAPVKQTVAPVTTSTVRR